MIDVIACQACKPEDSGCSNCGGFKVKLERNECPSCETTYWDFPRRGMTVYDGKRYNAFDGLEIVWRLDGKNECSKCEVVA
jgi:hypothetical protein